MLAMRGFPTPTRTDFRRELDRLFDGFLRRDPLFSGGVQAYPALNLWEDADKIYAEAEVPGLSLDDLDLSITGNELTIRGRRVPVREENVVYHRRERGTGEFSRFVTLPVDVDANRVEAALNHGVLTIVMPKAEQAKARKIQVKTG